MAVARQIVMMTNDYKLEQSARRSRRDDLRGCQTRLYVALATTPRMQADEGCNRGHIIKDGKRRAGGKKTSPDTAPRHGADDHATIGDG